VNLFSAEITPNVVFSFSNVHDLHNTGSVTPAFSPVRKPFKRKRLSSVYEIGRNWWHFGDS